jgi:hypothetical protein
LTRRWRRGSGAYRKISPRCRSDRAGRGIDTSGASSPSAAERAGCLTAVRPALSYIT